MSGMTRQAKPAVACPLDGGVRPHSRVPWTTVIPTTLAQAGSDTTPRAETVDYRHDTEFLAIYRHTLGIRLESRRYSKQSRKMECTPICLVGLGATHTPGSRSPPCHALAPSIEIAFHRYGLSLHWRKRSRAARTSSGLRWRNNHLAPTATTSTKTMARMTQSCMMRPNVRHERQLAACRQLSARWRG
jgi:hypothetical protein